MEIKLHASPKNHQLLIQLCFSSFRFSMAGRAHNPRSISSYHAVQCIKRIIRTWKNFNGLVLCKGTVHLNISYWIILFSRLDFNFWFPFFNSQCGVFNFKRRDNCFKCTASREESEKGGEGSDEVSNILTKSEYHEIVQNSLEKPNLKSTHFR